MHGHGGVNWSMHEVRREAARRSAASASGARAAESRVREARSRFERLELVCEAMWRLLQSRHHLTDAQLAESVRKIDLLDGKADGRKTRAAGVACAKCGKANSAKHKQCIYCGTWLERAPFA
jgi:hypothetical protein